MIADWLGRYDGLEGYLSAEDDPLVQVRNLLNQYVETGQPLEPEQFAGALADLRFCYCAARHDEGGARWDPLRDGAFGVWNAGPDRQGVGNSQAVAQPRPDPEPGC